MTSTCHKSVRLVVLTVPSTKMLWFSCIVVWLLVFLGIEQVRVCGNSTKARLGMDPVNVIQGTAELHKETAEDNDIGTESVGVTCTPLSKEFHEPEFMLR